MVAQTQKVEKKQKNNGKNNSEIKHIDIEEKEKVSATPHHLSQYGLQLSQLNKALTDINRKELGMIIRLIVLKNEDYLKPHLVDEIIKNFLKLKISVGRKGRKDLIELAKASGQLGINTQIYQRQKTTFEEHE